MLWLPVADGGEAGAEASVIAVLTASSPSALSRLGTNPDPPPATISARAARRRPL